MFEVGFTEIILILGLALLVLGPEKLPGLAEKIGRWTGRARAMARQLRTQLEQEVTLEEMAKSRPMQPAPPPTGSDSQSIYSPSPAPAAAPTPEFNLDAMVSGISAPPDGAPVAPVAHTAQTVTESVAKAATDSRSG